MVVPARRTLGPGARAALPPALLVLALLPACGRTSSHGVLGKDGSPPALSDVSLSSEEVPDVSAEADIVEAPAQSEIQTPDAQPEFLPDSPSVEVVLLDASVDAVVDDSPAEAGGLPEVAAMDAGTDAWPSEVASRQSVRFVVESQRVGWAVTDARLCSALNLERQRFDGTWQSLVLGIPFQCGCECPSPTAGRVAVLESLSSPPAVSWDAREFVVMTEIVKCPTVGTGTQDVPVLRPIPQPVSPGHYRATMAVYDALPMGCTDYTDAGVAFCSYPYGNTAPVVSDYRACVADKTAWAEFDLPESGDIEVDLLI